MRALFLILLFTMAGNICFSQANVNITDIRNIYDEKGDFYFDRGDYKKAIVYFNMAYRKDAKNYYSVLRKAEAFAKLELYDQAAECYRIIFETDLRIPDEFRLQFAFLLLKMKDIKGFEEWMGKYNKIVNDDIRGLNYLSTTETRSKLYKDSSVVIVENEGILNTAESEIAPVVYEDQVVFASTRKNLRGTAANSYYNLYTASYMSGGQLGRINQYNRNINSSKSESSVTFFDVTNSLFFTRGASIKSNLRVYEANIPVDATDAVDITELSIEGISSIGQPVFNSNGTTMYFVSEASGGQGGLDIYSSTLVGGKWSDPKNMGANINTAKDEMYPFVLNDTVLYFTSAGHGGLGGLDLYSVKLNQDNATPKNLGNKINTKYDDYSLTFSTGGLTGYFCSNRPGGFGKEDIYRLHLLDLKVKYAAYRFKRKTSMEEGKINLYLSSGEEYNIASEDKNGFTFGFQPEEDYKMVIQHENVTANNIINNTKLSSTRKRNAFLKPSPLQKTEIPLQAGMKYEFTAGLSPLSNTYKQELNEMTKEYTDPSNSTIDLTALAKELMLTKGEIYTIRFIKDDSRRSGYKAKGESQLFVNNQAIGVFGKSFFIVLPLDIQVNFNIKTDIAHFKETYNPKKVGTVSVDAGNVFKEKPTVKKDEGFPILVNTESMAEAAAKKILAKELMIVPGTEYILTLTKKDQKTGEKLEIFVPLTRGVKYNLGTEVQSKDEYNQALSKMMASQAASKSDEELIDISVLSKELDVLAGEDIVFNLIPAKKIPAQATTSRNVLTTLNVDGRRFFITNRQKLQVNLKLDETKKVNIQTDLEYVKENFEPSTIAMKLDTATFIEALGEISMNINAKTAAEVDLENKLRAKKVSIIPGKEYILTMSKKDAKTGKETEIIVPLTRKVKYDFTASPESEEEYKKELEKFLREQKNIETTGGELIDISLLSKELEIEEGDEVSFTLLPAKVFVDKKLVVEEGIKSNLYLDEKSVEITQIEKFSVNVPLTDEGQMNVQTDVEHIKENFQPGSYTLDIDTTPFVKEIWVDTTGYGHLALPEEITDPVFDVVVVNFDLNKYDVRPDAKATIDSKVIKELTADERLYVTIKGYTDALGDADYNERLSRNRAQAVKDYLARNGVGENRIRTFSFGESKALEEGINWEDLSEEELQKHRKVEIVIYLPK